MQSPWRPIVEGQALTGVNDIDLQHTVVEGRAEIVGDGAVFRAVGGRHDHVFGRQDEIVDASFEEERVAGRQRVGLG